MPRERLRIVSLVGFLDWNLTSKTGERGEEVNKEKKCDFCFDRIEDGKVPSCAETCPPMAAH